jgi:hypothetical protein
MMKNYTDIHHATLEDKLQLLAQGIAIGLTTAEAAVYGVEYADEYPAEEDLSITDDRDV